MTPTLCNCGHPESTHGEKAVFSETGPAMKTVPTACWSLGCKCRHFTALEAQKTDTMSREDRRELQKLKNELVTIVRRIDALIN